MVMGNFPENVAQCRKNQMEYIGGIKVEKSTFPNLLFPNLFRVVKKSAFRMKTDLRSQAN